MKRIIYQDDDGGISVYIPSPYSKTPLAEQVKRHVPQDRPLNIVNASDLPERDEFRGAWVPRDGDIKKGIDISMNKAREITKTRLRAERTPLLEEQDVAFQRALEAGTDTAEIVKEKQRLRDITKEADKAKTLDALKKLTCGGIK